MGAKYTTQATAGYDSSPPADDGSQTASNLITWAGIKSKLTTVLKTFSEAINTSLVNAFDYSVRSVTSSDNTVASDHMRCVEIASTVTTAVTVSLGDASTMTNVYRVFVKNSTAINQTVSRVTVGDTIDGAAANVTLPPGAGAVFQTNSAATGYVINSWYGPFSDASAVVAGGTDGTKKVRFEIDGLTTATTRVLTVRDANFDIGAATQAEANVMTSNVVALTPNTNKIILGTEQATTSGTSIDFTGIPSGVRRIKINFSGVSTNGTSDYLVQIGDSGGIETTGYVSTVSTSAATTQNSTAGFIVNNGGTAAAITTGTVCLELEDSSDFTWVASGILKVTTTTLCLFAGNKATSAELDRVRITTVNGTDAFDAGVINISYER